VAQTTAANIDPIWVEFAADDPHSFRIKAAILADELPEEIEQNLHVILRGPVPWRVANGAGGRGVDGAPAGRWRVCQRRPTTAAGW
jgi:hypothetical protein